jgi:hypothetical protein
MEDQDIIESLNEGSYPRYQYSVFVKNGRDEQLVIRANTFKELIEAKKNIDIILAKKEAQPVTPPPANVPICQIHNVPMNLKPAGVSKTTGKAYPAFWACSERLADGSFCKYKPQ